jgi:hypothetical protein
MRSPAIVATTKKRWALKRAEAGAAAKAEPTDESGPEKGIEVYEAPRETAAFCQRSCGRIISTMTVKSAAFFSLIGMILLTVLLAVGFIRDISGLMAGAIAAVVLLTSLIHLLASLSLAVFLYVFHKGQG